MELGGVGRERAVQGWAWTWARYAACVAVRLCYSVVLSGVGFGLKRAADA